jgi:hypothetical protein
VTGKTVNIGLERDGYRIGKRVNKSELRETISPYFRV